MAMQGINLGGWLVAERWITPSLFEGTQVHDEYSLSCLGEKYRRKISQHHHSFITEKDILWLKHHDITLLRVPVGYWLFGDEKPYVSSIDHLDRLFILAEKHGLSVLIDIHAAPGSQNGKRHSGKEGESAWHLHQSKLETFTQKLFIRYQHSPALWGVELLNEPNHHSFQRALRLWRYYYRLSRWIQQQSHPTRVVIAEGRPHLLWALLARKRGIVLDYHLYHGFHGRTIAQAQHFLEKSQKTLRKVQQITPVIIGEWSGVVSQKTAESDQSSYRKKQQDYYEEFSAQCYWTYKTEPQGVWSLKDISTRKS